MHSAYETLGTTIARESVFHYNQSFFVVVFDASKLG